MTQIVSTSFAAQNALGAKKVDYIFAIAGWPTLYSVARGGYAPAGDLANFTSVQPWADLPIAEGAAVKGRPEEGGMTIGQAEMTVLDRRYNGVRQMTDLLSRQAYLEGNSPGAITTLTQDLIAGEDTVINVSSTAGFPTSGFLYIGLECIAYNGVSPTAFNLPGFGYHPRGQLLTSATAHGNGALVYSFMPNLYRRRAFIYKGYQNLPLDQWARAFGGVVVGTSKQGPAVTFTLASTTWELYVNGEAVVFGKPPVHFVAAPIYGSHRLVQDVLEGDYTIEIESSASTANLGNGHHLINIGGHLHGINGVVVP